MSEIIDMCDEPSDDSDGLEQQSPTAMNITTRNIAGHCKPEQYQSGTVIQLIHRDLDTIAQPIPKDFQNTMFQCPVEIAPMVNYQLYYAWYDSQVQFNQLRADAHYKLCVQCYNMQSFLQEFTPQLYLVPKHLHYTLGAPLKRERFYFATSSQVEMSEQSSLLEFCFSSFRINFSNVKNKQVWYLVCAIHDTILFKQKISIASKKLK